MGVTSVFRLIGTSWLRRQGLSLPEETLQNLVIKAYTECQYRVGVRISALFNQQELRKFEEFHQKRDDKGALQLIATVAPYYRAIVGQEAVTIRREIRKAVNKETLIMSWPKHQ